MEIMLKHLVARYRKDVELLKVHPEHMDLLERRIERHEKEIIGYVTTDDFYKRIENMDL